MQTFTAILLNVVYPGAGYLYLKASDRKIIAKFLVAIWTLFIGAVIYKLIESLIVGNFYSFNGIEVPGLAVAMWIVMCIDTYVVARNTRQHAATVRRG